MDVRLEEPISILIELVQQAYLTLLLSLLLTKNIRTSVVVSFLSIASFQAQLAGN